MERTLVKDLKNQIGKIVTVKGFTETIRDQKAVQFVILRDHTGKVQLVHERGEKDPIGDSISGLTMESAISITGKVVENDKVKLGGMEIVVDEIIIESLCEPTLPIDIFGDQSNMEKRMDWRYLDLRRPENNLIFRVQTTVEEAMRGFWLKNNFIEINSPKLMGTPSESGAELFTIEKYFDREAYLAQSPQFYKQMAMTAGFDRVFEIGPVFRADPSFTSRHATEFTGVDMEISWVESHHTVMDMEAQWLKFVLEKVKEIHGAEIKELLDVEITVPKTPFPKITLAQAMKIVADSGHKPEGKVKDDLDPEGERIVAKYIKEKEGSDFVFVIDYPISVRPFYHMRHEDKPELTKSFDLLYKGVEITTGAQREHRYETLVKQAKEKGLDIEPMASYMNCFKYGTPPHGGLGLGLARLLMLMLDFKNIREVTYLFRGPNRLDP